MNAATRMSEQASRHFAPWVALQLLAGARPEKACTDETADVAGAEGVQSELAAVL
jgi:hypothetical protein